MTANLALSAGIFVISMMGVRYYQSVALRVGAIDVPNERSGHKVTVPRGAGIVFSLIALVAILASGLPVGMTILLAGAVAMVAVVGVLDDLYSLPARVRLLIHLLAGLLVVLAFAPWQAAGILISVGLVLWVAWSINLFNFMDGADGFAAMQGIVMSLGFAFFGIPELRVIWLVLAAALAGFLIWNLHPAKVFMGDAGSTFLGLMLGVGVVSEISARGTVGIGSLLLAAPFVLDATITLIGRIARRESLAEGHRLHVYQRWLDGGAHPTVVALGYAALAGFAATLYRIGIA